jgi:hypothetical protein
MTSLGAKRMAEARRTLRLGGVLCSLEYIACGRRTRYALCALDAEVHPSCIDGLKHLFGRSGMALRDAELFERFRPPCTWYCKGLHVEIQDLGANQHVKVRSHRF